MQYKLLLIKFVIYWGWQSIFKKYQQLLKPVMRETYADSVIAALVFKSS